MWEKPLPPPPTSQTKEKQNPKPQRSWEARVGKHRSQQESPESLPLADKSDSGHCHHLAVATTWICSKNYRNAFIYVLFAVRIARRPDVRAYKCCCAVRPAWGCQNKTQPMLHAYKEKQKMKPIQINWLTVASKLSFTAFAVSVAPLQTEWLEASFLQRPFPSHAMRVFAAHPRGTVPATTGHLHTAEHEPRQKIKKEGSSFTDHTVISGGARAVAVLDPAQGHGQAPAASQPADRHSLSSRLSHALLQFPRLSQKPKQASPLLIDASSRDKNKFLGSWLYRETPNLARLFMASARSRCTMSTLLLSFMKHIKTQKTETLVFQKVIGEQGSHFFPSSFTDHLITYIKLIEIISLM